MKTFSIKRAFRRGWELLKANKKLSIALTFIIIVLGAIQNVITNKHALGYGLAMVIIVIAFYVLATIMKIGFIKIYLKLEDNEPASLRELLSYSSLFWKYLGASILYFLVVLGGTILLIIPGIYWAVKYEFVPIIVVDEHVSIKQAFKMSAAMTREVKWKLIWMFILVALANIVGMALVLVGLFISVPVTILAYMHVYRKLGEGENSQVSAA